MWKRQIYRENIERVIPALRLCTVQLRYCPFGFFPLKVTKTNTANFIQLGAGQRFLPVINIKRTTHPGAKGPA